MRNGFSFWDLMLIVTLAGFLLFCCAMGFSIGGGDFLRINSPNASSLSNCIFCLR